jgi:hypothetical protein
MALETQEIQRHYSPPFVACNNYTMSQILHTIEKIKATIDQIIWLPVSLYSISSLISHPFLFSTSVGIGYIVAGHPIELGNREFRIEALFLTPESRANMNYIPFFLHAMSGITGGTIGSGIILGHYIRTFINAFH